MVGPLYTSHSDDEAAVRGPSETLAYYASMAQGQWVNPLLSVCALLEDLPALSYLGFSTDWANVSKKALPGDPAWFLEEQLATKALYLCLSLLAKRGAS
eukprot:10456211-Lingulodinium_polyedra.AAC.1